jgi:hypothetical protein
MIGHEVRAFDYEGRVRRGKITRSVTVDRGDHFVTMYRVEFKGRGSRWVVADEIVEVVNVEMVHRTVRELRTRGVVTA